MFKTGRRGVGQVSARGNLLLNLFLFLLSAACVYPLLFVLMISLSSNESIAANGYRLWPGQFSFGAYQYMFTIGQQIITSYGVTIVVTVAGTVLSVLITSLYAYAIARDDFRYRKFFTYLAIIPLLFSGGLVPFYMVSTQLLHFRNSLLGLIMPLAFNSFFIMILRTYFRAGNIKPLIEAAKIDGAGEFRIFFRIVLPLSLPGVATIALFSAFAYWGDWYNALLFIDQPSLTPVQAMLMNIQSNLQFIIQNSTNLSAQAFDLLRNMPTDAARMAVVILATVPIILAYPFFQRYFIRGLTVGGVKD
ncbi:MAG: carbohydrate ABC transporter permease [Negativicutes bacterium]|nr:carbohydrate ABC transporter permease [Negativicutes bacterium]